MDMDDHMGASVWAPGEGVVEEAMCLASNHGHALFGLVGIVLLAH